MNDTTPHRQDEAPHERDEAPHEQDKAPHERDEAIQRVMTVKARHEARLMQKANVVGVGVGFRERGGVLTDEVALVVNVIQKLPNDHLAPEDLIPSEIEGVPVDVRETGEMRAL